MKIALDFDETYTRDPPFWDQFIDNAIARGHEIRIVTFRHWYMTDAALEYLSQKIRVMFTDATQKRNYCNRIGWLPDIWIDDSPEFIVG